MTDEFDNDGMPPGWKTGPSLLSKGKFHDSVVDDFLRVVRWAQNDPARLMAQGKETTSVHPMGAGPIPRRGSFPIACITGCAS